MKRTYKKIKNWIGLPILVLLFLLATVFVVTEKTQDVYPTDDTMIQLYGESHGIERYYEEELKLWDALYKEGCRNLFVELPYYTAEYLNLWMQAKEDVILDEIFRDMEGTQSCTPYYYAFWQTIKEKYPETVLYGTDVGHQYGVTGARYLAYLEATGNADSENYRLAEECIRQGMEFYEEGSENGVSALRENYMVSNFIAAYERCGGGKIMGIYGSYHTDLHYPDRMGGMLLSHYDGGVSGVDVSSKIVEIEPYRFGFSVTGLIFLLMLFIPNIVWARGKMPEGYEEYAKQENKILGLFERIGEALVTAGLLIFPAINPAVYPSVNGIYINLRMLYWVLAFVLMIFYEIYWVRYFKSPRTMKDFYTSQFGFPVAGALLPVLAVLLLAVYAGNWILLAAGVILGIGHVGIHLGHAKSHLEHVGNHPEPTGRGME